MFHKPTLLAVRQSDSLEGIFIIRRITVLPNFPVSILRPNLCTAVLFPSNWSWLHPSSHKPWSPRIPKNSTTSYNPTSTLRGPGSNGTTQLIVRSRYPQLSPTEVYEIVSLYFNSVQEERHHCQVADKRLLRRRPVIVYSNFWRTMEPSIVSFIVRSKKMGRRLLNGRQLLNSSLVRWFCLNANTASRRYCILFYCLSLTRI
jgi:hypothetical protein